MVISMSYRAPSGVRRTRRQADVRFATNQKRDDVYFKGRLREPLAFREAIGALHDVVISDLKWRPDPQRKQQYQQFRKEQIAKYDREYWRLQRQYFEYLYKTNYDQWVALDPVITVHPDQIFFECFSKDESSYGRLAARQRIFEGVEELSAGTTNVDFSSSLYKEMQALRTYRPTDFAIDPSGIEVQKEGGESYKEKKIELPDSWLRGFVSVQSAMLLPKAISFYLDPVDVYNILTFMRRNRELLGPRGMRYELMPGEPVAIVLEPWEQRFVAKSSVYTGAEPRVIRTWGRRRLHLLERLLPLAKGFKVTLLGRGLPSFYHVDLGDMVFTLGLSGWVRNDWTGSTNFGLFFQHSAKAEREKAAEAALAFLKTHNSAPLDRIAERAGHGRDVTMDGLKFLCQAGKVMYDFGDDVYRYRPVIKEDVPLESLLYRDPREEEALQLVEAKQVHLKTTKQDAARKRTFVAAEVTQGNKTFHPELVFDFDGRLVQAESDDWYYKENKLYRGPSVPILAAKIAYERRVTMDEFVA